MTISKLVIAAAVALTGFAASQANAGGGVSFHVSLGGGGHFRGGHCAPRFVHVPRHHHGHVYAPRVAYHSGGWNGNHGNWGGNRGGHHRGGNVVIIRGGGGRCR